MPDKFHFIDGNSPEQNLRAFYDHLVSLDPELGPLVEQAVAELSPYPEDGPARSMKRKSANLGVKEALDQLLKEKGN